MKKNILFLALVLTSFLGYTQQVVVQNFDTPSSFNFAGFEGLGSASIQPDPAVGGTRMNGLRLVNVATGQTYQGAEVIQQTTKIKLTTDKTVRVDVYATQAFTMLLQVEVGGAAGNSATSQSYTTPNTWQTLTFNFAQPQNGTGVANGSYQNIVFFPNWNPNNSGFMTPSNFTVYVDNITSEATPILPDPVPTTAAPTPPNRPAADVKSIFCDALVGYTPVATLNYAGVNGQPSNDNTFNTSWCSASTTLVQIEGNNTNKITGLGCEGIAFLAGRFDATGFTRFHIDIWTPTSTQDKVFSFKFSNWNGTGSETNAWQYTATNANILTPGSEGTWISIDLPFSSPTFTCINTAPGNGCPSLSEITQFVITSNLGTVYYDNLYLHKNTTLSTNDFEASRVKLYPNPATNVLNIESVMTIEKVSVYNLLGQEVISQTPNTELVTLDVASLQVGVYVVKTSINGNTSSTRFIKE
jgi:hypothetical protein